MGRCRETKLSKLKRGDASLAKALAPEEIRRGDYVATLYVITEWPSWYWLDGDPSHPRDEPVRVCVTPPCDPQPLKVRGVCLPFVLVKTPAGPERTLDIRKLRLARLDRKFAGAAWRAYRRGRRSSTVVDDC